jgi:aromatic ring-cleaving dioxygenase
LGGEDHNRYYHYCSVRVRKKETHCKVKEPGIGTREVRAGDIRTDAKEQGDMKLRLKRDPGQKDFTTGRLFVDLIPECFTIEDEKRDVKVMHETRIPEGTYEIKLRTFGGHHERYKVKFPDVHHGMLWLQNVPGFKDILIHIGNTDDDSSGCILLGVAVDKEKGILYKSTEAYLRFYKKVVDKIAKGEKVTITIE